MDLIYTLLKERIRFLHNIVENATKSSLGSEYGFDVLFREDFRDFICDPLKVVKIGFGTSGEILRAGARIRVVRFQKSLFIKELE
jgi:hypothetical protein